jgi:hypothetical protein
MAKIFIENVVSTVRKVQAMSPPEQLALADEIYQRQPNLLTSCLIQHSLRVVNGGPEHTTDMLLVCFQSMKESGLNEP